MTTADNLTPTFTAPGQARDAMLESAAGILRRGMIVNGVLAALVALGGLLAGIGLVPGLFEALKGVLLFAYPGPADTALAIVALLLLLNISALLVLMVGVLAREVWALPAIGIVALANAAALVLLGFTPALITIGFTVWCGARISRDMKAFRFNPVMIKELRGRMRGVRAFAVLTVYLGLMSGFALLLYLVYNSFSRGTGSSAAGEIGRVLFMGVVGIELLLIIFIAPAFTAGAITGERERQTYDLLQTTLLSSPSFVIGKLESALGYIVLLLLAGVPLQSIAFLFGGVSELEVLLSFVILAVTAVALGTVGIYFSAAMNRTLTASVRAYGVILGAMFVAPVVLSILFTLVNEILFLRPNAPASPLISTFFAYINTFLTSINPIATALATQQLLIDRQITGFYTFTLPDGSTIPMVSPWVLFAILYLAASALLIVLTIRRAQATDGG